VTVENQSIAFAPGVGGVALCTFRLQVQTATVTATVLTDAAAVETRFTVQMGSEDVSMLQGETATDRNARADLYRMALLRAPGFRLVDIVCLDAKNARLPAEVTVENQSIAFAPGVGGVALCTFRLQVSDADGSAAASPSGEDVTVGTITFSVDGQPKRFSHAPAGHNSYTPLSSGLLVRPSAKATEQVMVTFLGINLRQVAFPSDLPLPRDLRKPLNPLAAMATVGFSYQAPDGQEWAGPGRVHVTSFGADGVIEGRFTNVSLPHTDKARPNIVLSDGSFRVRIAGR
jgi:hypothetical protein